MVLSWLDNDAHGEDNLVVTDYVLAVLDGVSASDGRTASSTLKLALEGAKDFDDVRKALKDADRALVDKQALTTVAGLVIGPDMVVAFSVGDSAIYHVPSAISRVLPLDREGGAVTQTIGSGRYRIHSSTLPRYGTFLLATDGIIDNLSAQELYSCTRGSEEETLEAIKSLVAKKKGENKGHLFSEFKEDDRALIVVAFESDL